MNRRIGVCLLALAVAACNSTERRWAAMCSEQEALGWPDKEDQQMSDLGEYATDPEKEQMVDLYEAKKAAEARVKATEEEGRQKGYIE